MTSHFDTVICDVNGLLTSGCEVNFFSFVGQITSYCVHHSPIAIAYNQVTTVVFVLAGQKDIEYLKNC
jgi:hypothetical protein